MKFSINHFCYFLMLAIFGCRGGCSDGTIVIDPDPNPDPISIEEVNIENINFFLENSKSMAGYIYFSTDFSRVIDGVLVGLSQRFEDRLLPHTIGEETGDYKGDLEEFRVDLNPTNNQRISIENSSLLHLILEKVVDSTGTNDISVLVTDGIMSGSNRDLKIYDNPDQNKYFNIDNASSRLKGDITLALKSKGNNVIKILAYHSDFHTGKKVGKTKYYYYKADNNKYSKPIDAPNNILPKKTLLLVCYRR